MTWFDVDVTMRLTVDVSTMFSIGLSSSSSTKLCLSTFVVEVVVVGQSVVESSEDLKICKFKPIVLV